LYHYSTPYTRTVPHKYPCITTAHHIHAPCHTNILVSLQHTVHTYRATQISLYHYSTPYTRTVPHKYPCITTAHRIHVPCHTNILVSLQHTIYTYCATQISLYHYSTPYTRTVPHKYPCITTAHRIHAPCHTNTTLPPAKLTNTEPINGFSDSDRTENFITAFLIHRYWSLY